MERELQYMSGFSNENESFIRVAWPLGGGACVLKTTLAGAGRVGAATIHNAYTMEERCSAIERLGGKYYADPKDCPYLHLR